MSGETDGKHAIAAAALAGGATLSEAAQVAGVTDRTLRRWRTDDAFRAEVRALTAQGLDGAFRTLAGAATGAARYLGAVADGSEPCDAGRVNAARLVLTLAPQLRDSVELEERLARVEALAGIGQPSGDANNANNGNGRK